MSTQPVSVAHCKIPISSLCNCKSAGASSGEPSNSRKYDVTIGVDTLFGNFRRLVFSPSYILETAVCMYSTLPIIQHLTSFMAFSCSLDPRFISGDAILLFLYCNVFPSRLFSIFVASTDITRILSTYISMYS